MRERRRWFSEILKHLYMITVAAIFTFSGSPFCEKPEDK